MSNDAHGGAPFQIQTAIPFSIGHRDDAVRRDLDGARGGWLMIVCTSTAVSYALAIAAL